MAELVHVAVCLGCGSHRDELHDHSLTCYEDEASLCSSVCCPNLDDTKVIPVVCEHPTWGYDQQARECLVCGFREAHAQDCDVLHAPVGQPCNCNVCSECGSRPRRGFLAWCTGCLTNHMAHAVREHKRDAKDYEVHRTNYWSRPKATYRGFR